MWGYFNVGLARREVEYYGGPPCVGGSISVSSEVIPFFLVFRLQFQASFHFRYPLSRFLKIRML